MDTKGIATKIHGIEVHGKDVLFTVEHLNLNGSRPLLRFHNEQLDSRNIAKKTCRILITGLVHIFNQLLGDGTCTAPSTPGHVS